MSNAGAYYFEDRCNPQQLDQIDWSAVEARDWRDSRVKEGKQAEFLIEHVLPWTLVEHIGVQSEPMVRQVNVVVAAMAHKPTVSKEPSWYY